MPTLPPDSSLTFKDLILRVAEECGLAYYDPSDADSPAAIPVDRQILDLIKRSVNDGIDRMARAYPKWTSLRPQVQIVMTPDADGPLNLNNPVTGEADASIYRLPWYITGRPVNGWQWSSQDSGFSGFARDVTPEEVDHFQRSQSGTGYPRLAAIVPSLIKGDAGADRQTKAVRFWPTPDQAYIVTGRFLVHAAKMVGLEDRHIFGASHDQTVLAFALWAFKEHDAKDPAMRSTYEARAMRALAESVKIDQESVQLDGGRMTDPDLVSGSYRQINPGVDLVTSSMTGVL